MRDCHARITAPGLEAETAPPVSLLPARERSANPLVRLEAPEVPVREAAGAQEPAGLAARLKEAMRGALYSLDRPGLRETLAGLMQLWVEIRDRNVPIGERTRVGFSGDVWYREAGGYYLTGTSPHWGASPFQVMADTEDYLFFAHRPAAGETLVSIGAGTGEDVLTAWRLMGKVGRIFAVEAHPRTAHCLETGVRLNGMRGVTVHRVAISDKNGTERIGDGESLSNTIVNGRGVIEVPARTVDTFTGENAVGPIDMLLMNIEGGERLAIRDMERTLRMTRYLAICCHDFRADRGDGEEMRTKDEVAAYLRSQGFRTTHRPNHPHPWVRCTVYGERL